MAETITLDAFVHMLRFSGERWIRTASDQGDLVAFVELSAQFLRLYEHGLLPVDGQESVAITVEPIGTVARIRQPHKTLMKVFAKVLEMDITPRVGQDQTWEWHITGPAVRVYFVETVMRSILTAYDTITRKMIDNLSLPTAEKRTARKKYTEYLANEIEIALTSAL